MVRIQRGGRPSDLQLLGHMLPQILELHQFASACPASRSRPLRIHAVIAVQVWQLVIAISVSFDLAIENAARRNLSFYEKVRFAAVIQVAGHNTKTGRQVLSLSARRLSHLTKIT